MLWSLYLRKQGCVQYTSDNFLFEKFLNIKFKRGIIISCLENSLLCNASSPGHVQYLVC